MAVRDYAAHPAVSELISDSLPQSARATAAERRRWRQAYSKGPRPMFEMFSELRRRLNADGWVNSRVDAYASIDGNLLDLIGGRDWPEEPELAVIDGGRK